MTTSGRVTVLQKSFADTQSGVSLVIQQLRFPPVSTGHADLMREDPACCGAAKPRHLESWSHSKRSHVTSLRPDTAK